jgi:hypothetical protein
MRPVPRISVLMFVAPVAGRGVKLQAVVCFINGVFDVDDAGRFRGEKLDHRIKNIEIIELSICASTAGPA